MNHYYYGEYSVQWDSPWTIHFGRKKGLVQLVSLWLARWLRHPPGPGISSMKRCDAMFALRNSIGRNSKCWDIIYQTSMFTLRCITEINTTFPVMCNVYSNHLPCLPLTFQGPKTWWENSNRAQELSYEFSYAKTPVENRRLFWGIHIIWGQFIHNSPRNSGEFHPEFDISISSAEVLIATKCDNLPICPRAPGVHKTIRARARGVPF